MKFMPGDTPLADFDRPIDMMQDCHRRVERFLDMLTRAGTDAPNPLDEEWTTAITTALTYFQGAAPLHTQDEEVSLFPRLRTHNDNPEVVQALEVITRLEHEHEEAAMLHEEHDELGRRWLRDGRLVTDDRERFVELSRQLQAIYVNHIRAEDEHVFVTARKVLTPREQEAIGGEMRARRGGVTCRERKAAEQSRSFRQMSTDGTESPQP